MKTLSLTILLAASQFAVAAPAPTHCQSAETTYFNCTLKGGRKVVSLCGKDVGGPASYLQYRYGTPKGGIELIYPSAKGDAGMGETFFFNPSGAKDNSQVSNGVWFEQGNTYYELKHVKYLGSSGEVTTHESEILMWSGVPGGAPRRLVCKQAAGGANLGNAASLIEAMSPKGRTWQMSPLDVHYRQRELQAIEKAAGSEVAD